MKYIEDNIVNELITEASNQARRERDETELKQSTRSAVLDWVLTIGIIAVGVLLVVGVFS